MVWILGRIYCTGTPQDYKAVHALQDKVSVVPLSAYGKPYTAPAGTVDPKIDTKTAVRNQVNAMDATAYYTLFAQLLRPILRRLRTRRWWQSSQARHRPRPGLRRRKLDPAVLKGLNAAIKPAQGKIEVWLKEGIVVGDMKVENGWLFTTKAGQYGTAYRQRALVTWIGLGANRPQDAVYPVSEGRASSRNSAVPRSMSCAQQGRDAPRQRLLVAHDV